MILKNHVAYRLLTDDSLALELTKDMYRTYNGKKTHPDHGKFISAFAFICNDNQKPYFVTNTVLDLLNHLKVKRKPENNQFDWRVFRDVPDQRCTFIFPDGGVLRVEFNNLMIIFCAGVPLDKINKETMIQNINWVWFYLNRSTNELAEHMASKDVREMDDKIYKLLCFIFLTENDEVLMMPGQKRGTQKQGKIINSLPFPLTIINSRWNTKVTVSGAFPVRGHFSIRWTGVGREVARLVFIEPFEKKGYVRNAGSESVK